MPPRGATLFIAAKAPRPGLTKTRLGRAIGQDRAVELYRAFVRDLAARFERAPFEIVWYITPPDAWPELEPLVGWRGRAMRTLAQVDGDWTDRQRALFQGAADGGHGRVILIASDSPHLEVETVADAFRLLEGHDLVLGPVLDGGYYLLGMRGWHDVLRDLPMSTSTVAGEIAARAEAAGLSLARLEPTFDIDEAADLAQLRALAAWRDDLTATRAVLATIPDWT